MDKTQAVIVVDKDATTAIIPTPGSNNPIYQEVCKYISIYSKGGEGSKRDNVTNAMLARSKRIKRQLDAEKKQDDITATKKLLKILQSQSESNWMTLEEEGFKEVAKEEEAIAKLFEKLLNR